MQKEEHMNTKGRLLSQLKAKNGGWISGEVLSGEFGISRAAINKHVQKLREEGYVIESSTKKGYILKASTSRLLANEICEGLNTKVFGKERVVHFNETDSTNIRAKELAIKNAPEGTVVIAERQTAGKGRKQRSWFSPAGYGIYASLILRPPIPPSDAPGITLMTAVAMADALVLLTRLPIEIKWPNDLLIRGKKIAGILTEISTEMDSIDYIVVGLGLNVNTPPELFPKSLRKTATSILIESGGNFSRIKILKTYLERFEDYYEMVTRGEFGPIMVRWKEFATVIGKRVLVEEIGRKYSGMAEDVDDTGVLIVRDDQGTFHRVFSADISYL